MHRSIFTIVLLTLLQQSVFADDTVTPPPPKSIQASRITDIVTVDGVLSEAVWKDPAITTLHQREPEEGKPATERTEVFLAYDDDALYIGARMYDTAPDSIIARLVRRDGTGNTDDIAIYIDPYYDRRSGFYFGINAAGTQYDGVLYNDDWDDNTWDGVWEGNVVIDKNGWTAEMRIPYSQLRFQPKDKQVWGVNFIREIARKNEKSYLVYTPKNESGFVSRFVDLLGIDNIEPPRRLEVLPYISTKAEYRRHDANDPFNDGTNYSAGFGADVKFGIGSNLTIDATINPDFGQVEVDPAVVNLSDVETFFEEKRPFFIEGSTIFNFGYGGSNNNWGFNWSNPDFFYTRRVGRTPQVSVPDGADFSDVPEGTHILGAAKLTGKLGDSWNIGSINAITARERADVDTGGHRSKSVVEPLTYYGVFRGQKEFNEGRQGFGFISNIASRSLTEDRLRDALNSSSFALGFDGWTFLDSAKIWVINGWTGMSYVRGTPERMIALQRSSLHYFQRPDAGHVSVDSSATHLQGFAGRIALNKQKGNFYVNAAFGFIDPKFDVNDVGFMWRTDAINGHLVLGYKWTEPNAVARNITINFSHFRTYDFDGNNIWQGVWHSGYMQFHNYYGAEWFFAYNPETISNRRTRGGPLSINPSGYETGVELRSDDRKDWIFTMQAVVSTYRLDADVTRNLSAEIEYKPAPNVSISVGPSFSSYKTSAQWIRNIEDNTATQTFGTRYVFGALEQREIAASIRLNWTFTPKLSLQMYVQPLISVGEYAGIKEFARPKTYEYITYGEGASTIVKEQNADGTMRYSVDPDGNGAARPFTLSDPNFNFKSLRGSAVLRWEYMPGSTIYFAWTQQRTDDTHPGSFRFGRDVSDLLRSQPDNIFLIKLSFWANP